MHVHIHLLIANVFVTQLQISQKYISLQLIKQKTHLSVIKFNVTHHSWDLYSNVMKTVISSFFCVISGQFNHLFSTAEINFNIWISAETFIQLQSPYISRTFHISRLRTQTTFGQFFSLQLPHARATYMHLDKNRCIRVEWTHREPQRALLTRLSRISWRWWVRQGVK